MGHESDYCQLLPSFAGNQPHCIEGISKLDLYNSFEQRSHRSLLSLLGKKGYLFRCNFGTSPYFFRVECTVVL